MNEDKARHNIFANEMINLYELVMKASKDSEIKFPEEMRAALPKSKREYIENINF